MQGVLNLVLGHTKHARPSKWATAPISSFEITISVLASLALISNFRKVNIIARVQRFVRSFRKQRPERSPVVQKSAECRNIELPDPCSALYATVSAAIRGNVCITGISHKWSRSAPAFPAFHLPSRFSSLPSALLSVLLPHSYLHPTVWYQHLYNPSLTYLDLVFLFLFCTFTYFPH